MTNQPTPIALLGGAGKAGRPLAEAALTAGYSVRLLLRHPDLFTLKHDSLTIIRGDARDPNCLRQLLVGCRAVLSTLGNPKEEGVPILSAVTQQLLPMMAECAIRRYVTVTSLYETDQPPTHAPTRLAAGYMATHFPAFMADRRLEYRLLQTSPFDWTYARLPHLVQAPPTGRVAVSMDHLPGEQITVADLAQWLLAQLDEAQYVGQAPFVANG